MVRNCSEICPGGRNTQFCLVFNQPSDAKNPLLQPFRRGQHLVGFGADPEVFSEIGPAHCAGGIHQELRRTSNVTAFWPARFVQQVVAADGFSLGIRQDREGIAGLAGQVARDFRRVHADGYRTHPGGLKLFQVFLDAS